MFTKTLFISVVFQLKDSLHYYYRTVTRSLLKFHKMQDSFNFNFACRDGKAEIPKTKILITYPLSKMKQILVYF